MTHHWDIQQDGSLAVWTHDQDPQTDDPAQTTNGSGYRWTKASCPPEVQNLLRQEWDSEISQNGVTERALRIHMGLTCGDIARI